MRLKRVNDAGAVKLVVDHGGGWIELHSIPGCEATRDDMIPVLDSWLELRPQLVAGLNAGGFRGVSSDAVDMLPFEITSFRDCLIDDKHAIAAAESFVRTEMKAVHLVASLYKSVTRRPFPPLTLGKLFQRQAIYYMGNHLSFVIDGPVEWPSFGQRLDYELEMGFVITRQVKNANREQARDAIGGFAILNDFSVRDAQVQEMMARLGPAKSKHFRNGISATVATADDILDDYEQLQGEVLLNGRSVATSCMGRVQHSVVDLVVQLSRDETLFPGEFIGTGTMVGCCAWENGCWPKIGDELELRVERIGSLTTRFVENGST